MSKRNSEFAIIWRGLAVGLGFVFIMGFAIGYRDGLTPWFLLGAATVCWWLSRN
jgi:hypothetical protein